MRFGFAGDDEPVELDSEPSQPSHVGDVGQLTTSDDSNDDDESGFTFTHHIYFAVHVGPFMFVLGRPE